MIATADPSKESKTAPRAPVKYNEAQAETVKALIKIQKDIGDERGSPVSDEEFTAKHLRAYSAGAWSKLRRNEYEAQTIAPVFAKLGACLKNLRRMMRLKKRATQGTEFQRLPVHEAVFEAVTQCLSRSDERRIVVYVAPTGGGKSRLIEELRLAHELSLVRANETWRKSYYYALCGVCRGLSTNLDEYKTPSNTLVAREQMLGAMNGLGLVAIDEGNYFGTHSLNLVKDMVNDTAWTVLLCTTPQGWKDAQRYAHEFGQLRRRIFSVYEYEPLSADEVGRWLTPLNLGAIHQQACVAVSDAAREFGAIDMVNRVAEKIADSTGTGHPSMGDIESAITLVKAELRGKESK